MASCPGERVAPDVRGADPDRGAEGDQVAGGVAQLELVAVDAGGVDDVAVAGAEPHLEVAAVGLIQSRPTVTPLSPTTFSGVVAVAGTVLMRSAVAPETEKPWVVGPAGGGRWCAGRGVLEVGEVDGDRHRTRPERSGEQVAVLAVADRDARRDRDAVGAHAAEGELVPVDAREHHSGERAEVDVDVGAGAGRLGDRDALAGHGDRRRGRGRRQPGQPEPGRSS